MTQSAPRRMKIVEKETLLRMEMKANCRLEREESILSNNMT